MRNVGTFGGASDFHLFRRGVELRPTSLDNVSSFEEPLVPSILKAIARAPRCMSESLLAGSKQLVNSPGSWG